MAVTPDKPSRPPKPKGLSLAAIRRNKSLSTDGHTVRFLYLMLKQSNLKAIDWQMIANKTEMSEGRVARARFTRFRTQMEKILRSEDLLEAKIEEDMEDPQIEGHDTKDRVFRYLDQLEVKSEYVTDGMDIEQDEKEERDNSKIKSEPHSSATPLLRVVKLEFQNFPHTVPRIAERPLPMVIKIEDDDTVEAIQGSYNAGSLTENSRNRSNTKLAQDTQSATTTWDQWPRRVSLTNTSPSFPRRTQNESTERPTPQKRSNVFADSDVEYIGSKWRQSTSAPSPNNHTSTHARSVDAQGSASGSAGMIDI